MQLSLGKISGLIVKFRYCKKTTKFEETSLLVLTLLSSVKTKRGISSNFMAFSEYVSFRLDQTSLYLGSKQFYETVLLMKIKGLETTTGTSILGEVRNVEISRVTQQLLCSKSHDFLAVFALAHSKITQIA